MAHKRLWIYFGIIIVLILAACGPQPESTPLAEEPTQPPAEPTPIPFPSPTIIVDNEADLIWADIQESGVMVVGTSVDYPPFAFYTQNYEMDGFDIALARAVAAKLGVELKLQDLAFNSLIDAVRLGQIDVAIAAMSVTSERAAIVGFSDIYYVGEDAVLGTAVSPEITEASQLIDSRVGVQSQSVYENWARVELVEPGFISENELYIYAEADHAVKDLGNGRLDYVILDLAPAELAAVTDKLSIVGQSLNRQQFAIALPAGAPDLQTEINRALEELKNEDLYAELAKQYLDIDDLLPTNPQPQLTPIAISNPDSCVDAMAFSAHLNLDDQNMSNPPQMLPGQTFRKGWRVQNLGNCSWDSQYGLAYVEGNAPAASMGGSFVAVAGEVKPGEVYDFYVDLVAPIAPGTYQGFWSMRNAEEMFFGQRLWVGISVVADTSAPTSTPAPEILFNVDRSQIKQGECVQFEWQVENIQAIYFYAEGEPWDQNGVSGQGDRVECPQATTVYYLRVVQMDDTIVTIPITIIVQPVAGSPVIELFALAPENQISWGQCVNVSWKVSDEVTEVTLSRNDLALWETAPVQGNLDDCPPAGTMVYVIEASGPGGTSRVQQNLSVDQFSTETPQPTITPLPTETLLPASPLPTAPPLLTVSPLPTAPPLPTATEAGS